MDGMWTAAIDALKDPVFLLDVDSRIINCNSAAEDFLGTSRSNFLGEHCYKQVHKCDQPVENCAFQKMLKTKKREVFVLNENGEFLEVAVDPTTSNNFPSLKAIHVIRNVSEQKKNEESLTLFRNMVDHGNDAIYVVDPKNGNIVDVNERACLELGFSREELLKRTVIDLDDTFDDIEVWKSHLGDLRAVSGMLINGIHRRKDGTTFDAEVSTRYTSINGRDVVIGIARNITDKKVMYDKMEFLSAVVKQVKDSIIVMNKDFDITYVNDAALELYGYSKDEILGSTPIKLIARKENSSAVTDMQKVLEKGLAYTTVGKHVKKNEKEFFCESKTTPMFDADGKTYYVSVCRDITDLVSAEKTKRRMQEHEKDALVGKVAGKAAHDFNNILGIILGTTQLMLMDNQAEPLIKDLNVIKESAIMGREVTRNLVFFAKAQEPKLSLFDLNNKIKVVLSTFAGELKTINVDVVFQNETEEILADSIMMQNTIVNLLRNSLDAVSLTPIPCIKIRTGRNKENIFLEVEDNGCGIPPEYVNNVFDPAFTLKGSADRLGTYKNTIKGSGYGLANVKRTVDKHMGEITVNSTPDKNTVFRMELPVLKEKVDLSEFRRSSEIEILSNKRILIVEDEPHLAKVLSSVLSSMNHTVDIAPDGASAIKLFNQFKYDAISLDFMLPDVDGMDVYREIRNRNATIPIVFVSGNFEFIKSVKDLENEDSHSAHLSKPFDNLEYAKIINKYIAESLSKSS